MNGATWVMAIFTGFVALFTFLLWSATKKYSDTTKEYTEITRKLLRQSKKAFEQSQKAFENDLFGKIVFSVLQLAVQQKRAPQNDLTDLPLGMLQAIKKTDRACYKRIKKTVEESWGDQKVVGTVSYIRGAIKNIEEKEKRETDMAKQGKKANK